jgi:hypothetical protein
MAKKNQSPRVKQQDQSLNWDTLDAARYLRDFPVKEKSKESEPPQTTQNDQGQ